MRVAIIQEPAAVLDLRESVDRAARHIRQAGRDGAQFIAFPEVWLTCYPVWMFALAGWDDETSRHWYQRLVAESPTVDSDALLPLRAAAREFGCVVTLGLNERAGAHSGTLYNTLLTIGPDGGTLNVHRKLIPTHTERIIWRASPDAAGLRAFDTPFGRVGGAICWEHWQPLIRQALHLEGEQVHVASWPNAAEIELLASRTYAFEGRCFVLAAAQYLTAADVPTELQPAFRAGLGMDKTDTGQQWRIDASSDVWFTGGSGIIGPDGEWVVAPLRDEAGILVADLDLARTLAYKQDLDVAGHYARPDIFGLTVDRRLRPDVRLLDEPRAARSEADAEAGGAPGSVQ